MKHFEKSKGITLIALVITIIVLLILATVSITTLTGENGILTRASKAEKDTDIAETKEQIKLEVMGNLDEQQATYTNQDVINAVRKITEKTVTVSEKTVESKKGNIVDIEDLWVNVKPKCYFRWYEPNGKEHLEEFFFQKGDIWNSSNEANTGLQMAIDAMSDAWETYYYATADGDELWLREQASPDVGVFKVNENLVSLYEEIIPNAIYYFEYF